MANKTNKLEDTYVIIKDEDGNIIMPEDLNTLNVIQNILSYKIRDNEDILYKDDWYTCSESSTFFRGKRHTIISLKNITKYKTMIETLSTDAVTNIPTRETTTKAFCDYLEYATQAEEPFAVIMADLDNFKQINDTYGHYGGDAVLYRVAQALKTKIRHEDSKLDSREKDIVGRFGGDEFIVILKGIDEKTAIKRIEEIRETVENIRYEKDGVNIKSDSISLGITYISKDIVKKYKNNTEELRTATLTKADAALYESKKSGRNKVTSYTLK